MGAIGITGATREATIKSADTTQICEDRRIRTWVFRWGRGGHELYVGSARVRFISKDEADEFLP